MECIFKRMCLIVLKTISCFLSVGWFPGYLQCSIWELKSLVCTVFTAFALEPSKICQLPCICKATHCICCLCALNLSFALYLLQSGGKIGNLHCSCRMLKLKSLICTFLLAFSCLKVVFLPDCGSIL